MHNMFLRQAVNINCLAILQEVLRPEPTTRGALPWLATDLLHGNAEATVDWKQTWNASCRDFGECAEQIQCDG